MPLSRHVGFVSHFSQGFGEEDNAGAKSLGGGSALHGGIGIKAGEQTGPRGPAHVVDVVIGEAQSAPGQLVQGRGFDFTPIAPQVGITHVVRHDQDDVGPGFGRGSEQRETAKRKKR